MSAVNPTKFKLFSGYNLVHANSTRIGGVSLEPYNTLNLGMHTGDNREDVAKNRSRYFNYLGADIERAVYAEQVHGSQVTVVSTPGRYTATDALITAEKDLFLTIQTADCFPLFMYDPVKEVCALVHSGWRGTAQNIASVTIKQMTRAFKTNVKDVLVAIGAGIQQAQYQVDSHTAAQFDKNFWKDDGPGHAKLNVQGAIIAQLLNVGILKRHIEVDERCTFKQSDIFYSYRRDGKSSGRMMGVIGMP